MFLMYCISSIPLIYLYSFLPISELVGLIVFVVTNILICFLDMVLGFIVVFFQGQSSAGNGGTNDIGSVMTSVRLVISIAFPTVNLKHSLFNIHLRSNDACVAAVSSVMKTSYSSSEPWMSMKAPGLGLPFLIFVCQTVFFWLMIVLLEGSIPAYFRKSFKGRRKDETLSTTPRIIWTDSVWIFWTSLFLQQNTCLQALDEDVRQERQFIVKRHPSTTSAVVIVEDLVQTFQRRKGKEERAPEQVAVNHLNFYVPQGSCFGLLGKWIAEGIVVLNG